MTTSAFMSLAYFYIITFPNPKYKQFHISGLGKNKSLPQEYILIGKSSSGKPPSLSTFALEYSFPRSLATVTFFFFFLVVHVHKGWGRISVMEVNPITGDVDQIW